VHRNRSSGMARTPCEEYTNNKNKQTKGRTKNCGKLDVRPAHKLNPILTKFSVCGGLPDVILKFEFQDDRSINVGAVGVEICLFPLTRLITYTTACCFRTSHDYTLCAIKFTFTYLLTYDIQSYITHRPLLHTKFR